MFRCTAIAVTAALLAWGFWWAELIWIKGWMSLAWLDFNWAAIPICVCIAGATVLCMSPKGRWLNRFLFLLIASAILFVAYDAGRMAVYGIFAAMFVLPRSLIVILLLCYAAVCIVLPFLTARLLAPVSIWRTSAGLAVALPLAIVLSYATIAIVPAINGATDLVHMFKMGYPVFWLTLLVPLTLRLGRKSVERTPA